MKKKIMVVDDEPDNAYTVEINLKGPEDNYDIICVNSGKKCLELLEKNQIPDLILLDIMMPEMNGWEVFDIIKANPSWNGIPIIFVTGTDKVVGHARAFLGENFIEKPYNPVELKEKINKILEKK